MNTGQGKDQSVWPTELRLAKERDGLCVSFDNGEHFDISAELLRVQSPSAEVRGHTEAERKTVGGKRNVKIIGVDQVGNYAVRLRFDDMHDSGIYSWDYLRELGLEGARRFATYEGELAAKGLSRDRPGQK